MIVSISNYDTPSSTARRDNNEPYVYITEFVTSITLNYSVTAPYEQARVDLSLPINELNQLGIGTPRRLHNRNALHASGWLNVFDEGVRVFFGPIQQIATGLSILENGARQSSGVSITAVSWLQLLERPFKLTSRDELLVDGALYDYNTWSEIFEGVFSRGAAVDVADGLKHAWTSLIKRQTPDGEQYSSYPVLVESSDLEAAGIQRTLTRVRGKNISQVPVDMSGSLWSLFTSLFQPAPQLIELFPIRENGEAYLMYRMKPLPPRFGAQYFEDADALLAESEPPELDEGEDGRGVFTYVDNVFSYSLSYENERANYIEVTSTYFGVSQLAGLNSDPYLLQDDIKRYGLHDLSITYPLFRSNSGSIRDDLEYLTKYAAALYSEGHAYARGSLECAFDSRLKVGEWVRWFDYSESSGATLTGYVTMIAHSLRVDPVQGTVKRRTSLTLERISLDNRPSFKLLESGDFVGHVEATLGDE